MHKSSEYVPFHRLKPLTELTESQNIRVWIDAALTAFEQLPEVNGHEYMLEHGMAVCECSNELSPGRK